MVVLADDGFSVIKIDFYFTCVKIIVLDFYPGIRNSEACYTKPQTKKNQGYDIYLKFFIYMHTFISSFLFANHDVEENQQETNC